MVKYHLDLECAFCKKITEDILFIPKKDLKDTFECIHCDKENHIKPSFKAYKRLEEGVKKNGNNNKTKKQ